MEQEESGSKILQLSDCVMMCILSYLDATSLYNLSETCGYFKNIVEDPKLWRYIEARNEPNTTKKVQYICDRVHDRTTHILFKAENRYTGIISQDDLIPWNRIENLTVLALENQRFNGKTLNINNFPSSLDELSLKRTSIKNSKMFFRDSFSTMKNLRVLILDYCTWLDSSFFMSVAKYQKLELLSLVGCTRLHINSIPYLNVARHGCQKLKLIDCRFNTVGKDILEHLMKGLVALYFQSMSSYEIDTGKLFMRCPLSMTLENQELISQSIIRSESLERYKNLVRKVTEELPKSMLYEDPYPECSCGWKHALTEELESEDKELMKYNRTMSVDDYIDFNLSPRRFICRRHMRDLNKLPPDFKDFFYQSQRRFYTDLSDSNSDSDDESDCCMFGIDKYQMIVLKVNREADEQGNIPQPEVIDVFRPSHNEGENENRPESPQEQGNSSRDNDDDADGPQAGPSTSKDENSSNSRKRKHENADDAQAGNSKKQATESPPQSTINVHIMTDQPGTSGSHPTIRIQRGRNYIRVHRIAYRDVRHQRPNNKANNETIKLRRLALRGYRDINDDIFGYIQDIRLDLLDVAYTSVTKKGIADFLTLNPNCRVIHQSCCVCKPILPS